MNISNILRISRWELNRDTGILNRKTLLLIVLSVALVGGVFLTGGITQPDSGLYTVGVSESSEYHDAFMQHDTLRVVPSGQSAFSAGDIDAYVAETGEIYTADTETGRSAATELRMAVRNYNTRVMDDDPDQSAAFPVRVSVTYVPQDQSRLNSPGSGESGSTEVTGSTESNSEQGAGSDSTATHSETDDSSEPTENMQSASNDSKQSDNTDSVNASQSDSLTGLTGLVPSQMSPPLPFESLLIAFVLLIPLNFISQTYASSMIAERTNREGELLLVSPLSQGDIVIGKTLPYLIGGLGISGLIVLAADGGLLGFLGTVPLTVAFLSLSFISSSFARSYKELSFFILGVSVLLMSYSFIPAIFTQVSAISSISPLSLVVADLNGVPIPIARIVLATVPLLGVSVLIFAFGIITYKEEFLFTQQSLPDKCLTTLATTMSRPRNAFVLGAVSIPFVFIVELLALATLLVVPQLLSIPLLLVIIALIEEIGKSLPIFAAFKSKSFSNTHRIAVLTGFLAGFGFFVAEKVMVIGQKVGLNGLELGEVIFATASTAPGTSGGGVVGLIILVLWPFLHSITAIISAVGARYGYRGYVLSLLGATAVHVAYNFTVVILYA